jgi:hypothetical protein
MEALLDLLGEQDLGKRLAARPSAPGDRATRPSPVRVTAPGTGIPGAVHRSDVDARLVAVEVRPRRMGPTGRAHGDQRRDIGRQSLPGPCPSRRYGEDGPSRSFLTRARSSSPRKPSIGGRPDSPMRVRRCTFSSPIR